MSSEQMRQRSTVSDRPSSDTGLNPSRQPHGRRSVLEPTSFGFCRARLRKSSSRRSDDSVRTDRNPVITSLTTSRCRGVNKGQSPAISIVTSLSSI